MKSNIFFSVLIILSLTTYGQNKYPQDFFTSPIDFKMAIAGTFGELRNNHFHSGIDIKTKQKTNIPIYAAQDGYISRVKVSTHGFGKALYINHPNGFTTVYAHLEKFNDNIEQETEKRQYEKESFEIDFSLNDSQIKVQKGEVIGFSGNTGSSTAPHLHFEIRNTKTQQIINPMLFGFPILDRTYPIINSVLIYHQNGRKELIPTKKIRENQYELVYQPNISGPFNVGINTYDLLDAAPNKNGVYSIELYHNDSLYFSNEMTKFAFSETRYINSHIDYEYYKNTGVKFQKCFLDLNNKISTNKKNTKHSLGEPSINNKNRVKLVVKDSYKNTTTLDFEINAINNQNYTPKNTQSIMPELIINAKQVFEFKDDNFEIYIPNNSLYKNYPFRYNKIIDSMMVEPIYKILDDSIPSHKNFVLSITPNYLPIESRQKALIGRIVNDEIFCIKSQWQENKIIGQSNKFGAFTIVIDTIKPNIKYDEINENMIRFKISDELSGIKEYRGEIDGKWVLMEYDFKTEFLHYNFKTEPKETTQTLTLSVSDYAENTEIINIEFFR